MTLKDHTIRALVKQVGDLNTSIETLKVELGSNTQAIGFNTHAVEGITASLLELAKETGSWRQDDRTHHEDEGNLDRQKIAVGKEIVEALRKK